MCTNRIRPRSTSITELQTWQLRLLAAAAGKDVAGLDRSKLVSAGFEATGALSPKPWLIEDAQVWYHLRSGPEESVPSVPQAKVGALQGSAPARCGGHLLSFQNELYVLGGVPHQLFGKGPADDSTADEGTQTRAAMVQSGQMLLKLDSCTNKWVPASCEGLPRDAWAGTQETWTSAHVAPVPPLGTLAAQSDLPAFAPTCLLYKQFADYSFCVCSGLARGLSVRGRSSGCHISKTTSYAIYGFAQV